MNSHKLAGHRGLRCHACICFVFTACVKPLFSPPAMLLWPLKCTKSKNVMLYPHQRQSWMVSLQPEVVNRNTASTAALPIVYLWRLGLCMYAACECAAMSHPASACATCAGMRAHNATLTSMNASGRLCSAQQMQAASILMVATTVHAGQVTQVTLIACC